MFSSINDADGPQAAEGFVELMMLILTWLAH
jgi:hypothetical protein